MPKEENAKINIAKEYFAKFDYSTNGRIDFVISDRKTGDAYLWAEVKADGKNDFSNLLTQLAITIYQDKFSLEGSGLPKYLGMIDSERMQFVEYAKLHDFFRQQGINTKMQPSNYSHPDFEKYKKMLIALIAKDNSEGFYDFNFRSDSLEGSRDDLQVFIEKNFNSENKTGKIDITEKNFIHIFQQWESKVKPQIDIDWKSYEKKHHVYPCDFFYTDVFLKEGYSFREKFRIILGKLEYRLEDKTQFDTMNKDILQFKDEGKAYSVFWNLYERPPEDKFEKVLKEKRGSLVPVSVRERAGTFFTPRIWVEKSQEYLADVLGRNWQDEYYIWDCAAGYGNLLDGLANPENIFASTLEQVEVDTMLSIYSNLQTPNVFQFDFLNDEFKPKSQGGKLPDKLFDIIDDKEKQKKLVIYINPPYAEAANYGKSKDGVSSTKVYKDFKDTISFAVNELFSQFFACIYRKLPNCKLASFSKLLSAFSRESSVPSSPGGVEIGSLALCCLHNRSKTHADDIPSVSPQLPEGREQQGRREQEPPVRILQSP